MESIDRLLNYTIWANNVILAVLEKYGAQAPAASIRLMSHLANSQTVWLARLRNENPAVGIWDEHDLETIKRMNGESLQGFKALLDRPDAGFNENIDYKNSMGMSFQNSVHDIFLQMLSHGCYHRGQVAMQLRQNGLDPVNTDYIMYLRTT